MLDHFRNCIFKMNQTSVIHNPAYVGQNADLLLHADFEKK